MYHTLIYEPHCATITFTVQLFRISPSFPIRLPERKVQSWVQSSQSRVAELRPRPGLGVRCDTYMWRSGPERAPTPQLLEYRRNCARVVTMPHARP